MIGKEDTDETIVAAALYVGYTISMPPPARHGQLLHALGRLQDALARKE